MNTDRGYHLYQRAKEIIPGGVQLFSKRPELYSPLQWPSYFESAKGFRVVDLDKNHFVDVSTMSVGACILGYADDEVDTAVIKAIRKGVSSSLNCPEEVELAELLTELHPWANSARFVRGGGEAMAVAIRIARAATGKTKIFFSGYHGWCDWYLAANLVDDDRLSEHLMAGLPPRGVPPHLEGSVEPFMPGDLQSLIDAIDSSDEEVAAIAIEPARGVDASPEYLSGLRKLASSKGIVLIFDEITSGFRLACGGAHLHYGVNPDIAVFAKSMANGYAMGAIVGRSEIMDAAKKCFISSTNWTERIGPVASIATIKKHQRESCHETICDLGEIFQKLWATAADNNNVAINISGIKSLPSFSFEDDPKLTKQTTFTSEMLKRGYLAFKQFRPSLAHKDLEIDRLSEALDEVFFIIGSRADLDDGTIQQAEKSFARITTE